MFESIIIVLKTKIMFFNNTLINNNIFNEICELIVKINENEHFIVTFLKTNNIEINYLFNYRNVIN